MFDADEAAGEAERRGRCQEDLQGDVDGLGVYRLDNWVRFRVGLLIVEWRLTRMTLQAHDLFHRLLHPAVLHPTGRDRPRARHELCLLCC